MQQLCMIIDEHVAQRLHSYRPKLVPVQPQAVDVLSVCSADRFMTVTEICRALPDGTDGHQAIGSILKHAGQGALIEMRCYHGTQWPTDDGQYRGFQSAYRRAGVSNEF